jgi:GNAT superfamily N-acetyltransferase
MLLDSLAELQSMDSPTAKSEMKRHLENAGYFENLVKAPLVAEQDPDFASNVLEGAKFNADEHQLIFTKKLKNGMFHHVYRQESQPTHVIHSLSLGNPEHPIAAIDGNVNGNVYIASETGTHPRYQGQGLGTGLKALAAKYHGIMESDTITSPAEHKTWQNLKAYPNLKVKLGDTQDSIAAQTGMSPDDADVEDEAHDSSHRVIYQKPKKLAASESLAKAPVALPDMDTKVMTEPDQPTIRSKVTPLPNGLIYEQREPKRPDQGLKYHTLINPKTNERLAFLETRHMADAPNSVMWGEVHPDYRGKGLGRQLYLAAALHMKQLHSDNHMTSKANGMWESFKDHPGMEVDLAPYGNRDRNDPSINNGRHSMVVSDPSKIDYGKMFHKVDLGKSEELDKGQNGDWQKEGYKFEHIPGKDFGDSKYHTIKVTDRSGNFAGHFDFDHLAPSKNYPEHINVRSAVVSPLHRRMGLANNAYKMIEGITGSKILNSPGNQSEDAKSLWSQPNRPFGKSELDKAEGFYDARNKYPVDLESLAQELENSPETTLDIPEVEMIRNAMDGAE